MKSIFWQFVVVVVLSCKGVSANQNPYANYPPPPPPQYQQQQQDPYASQQYSQPGPPSPPSFGGPPPGYDSRGPPPGYDSRGPPPGYGRQHMPPLDSNNGPIGTGLFSKLKSGIMAAGSAIAGLDGGPPPQQLQQRRRPVGGAGPPPPQQGYGRAPMPPSSGFGPPMPTRGMPGNDDGGVGLFGKIKNLFGADDSGSGQPMRRPLPNSMPPPPHGYGPPPPASYGQQQQQQPASNSYIDPANSGIIPHPPQSFGGFGVAQDSASSQQFGGLREATYPGNPQSMLPPDHTQQLNRGQPQPYEQQTAAAYADPYHQPPIDQHYGIPPPPPEPEVLIAPEPQILIVEDCVVLIPRPRDFYRKKVELTRGGPSKLQVFADFEHVVTRFKNDEGQRSVSSAELIEGSNALLPQAAAAIKALSDEYAAVEMDGRAFEELTTRVQAILAKEGGLHISSVAPVTRELSRNAMPLRDGWKEAFQGLSAKGVPLYVFSSGYGDVVAQALLLNGISEETSPALPQNLRIISNFFRTAPDGTVRAFSQPVVHERNKNATTASRHMGMPVPDRPNALIFGSTEDDVMMTDGLDSIQEKMSVGFMELTEDLPRRLPSFIDCYDAIILGDGSFHYVKTLLCEVLGLDANLRKKRGMNLFERGLQDIF